MPEKAYDTDLIDAEWEILRPLIPPPARVGRKRTHQIRRILNGLLYLLRTGCAWRLLPHDLPPWSAVYYYYATWRDNGVLTAIHDTLRRRVRVAEGRDEEPTAAILDSQSVKTTDRGGPHGYDAGKKVNGRKRHLLVDTLGLVIGLLVHCADIQDRDGARLLLSRVKAAVPRLKLIWADGGYAGQLVHWVQTTCQWVLEIVRRSDPQQGFEVLPRRWVIERTFGWFGKYRRLSKDYEFHTRSSEAMLYLAMIHIMARRLAPLAIS